MIYRTDYSFGAMPRGGDWVLVCAPNQDAPHASTCSAARDAAAYWAGRNRATFAASAP